MLFKRKNRKGFTKFSYRFAILSAILFIVGQVCFTSYEATLNIEQTKLEKEIAVIESDIDGLNMKKNELTQFTRLHALATEQGYKLTNQITTAAVIKSNQN